ncbi:hypothetical protein B0H14DRAFT_2591664 [Mycena olivaceomarginata]|nr:hypothetical protein B0H14DRAFT_2591664 [Mycena olivaceomarginata]
MVPKLLQWIPARWERKAREKQERNPGNPPAHSAGWKTPKKKKRDEKGGERSEAILKFTGGCRKEPPQLLRVRRKRQAASRDRSDCEADQWQAYRHMHNAGRLLGSFTTRTEVKGPVYFIPALIIL